MAKYCFLCLLRHNSLVKYGHVEESTLGDPVHEKVQMSFHMKLLNFKVGTLLIFKFTEIHHWLGMAPIE